MARLHAARAGAYRLRRMLIIAQEFSSTAWAIGLLLIGPITCVALFRSAKFPLRTVTGRAIIAGVVAGLLFGPTVLGRIMPERFESSFVGGVKERQALEYAHWFHANVPQAIKNLSDEARAAQREQGHREVMAKQQQMDAARWRHQQPMRVMTMIVVALALLGSSRLTIRRGDRDLRQGWITPLSVGLGSIAVPGTLAYLIALRWWEVDAGEAAMLAAAVGIGPWGLGMIDREVASGAEVGGSRMMQTAGRIASMVAIAVASWAAWNARSWDGLVLIAPLLALPLAWLGDLAPPRVSAAQQPIDGTHELVTEAALAMLAALVMMRIDLHEQMVFAALGLLLVLGLLACDGRWLGAFFGAMLPGGRPVLRTMRLVIPAMAAGPTQLAVAALSLHGGMLSDRFALPLLAGALVIEITAPARRHMAAQLIHAETEVESAE